MYKQVIRPFLFNFDPEQIHDVVLSSGACLVRLGLAPLLDAFYGFEDPRLSVESMGLHFANPIGLAAGFDKNCQAPEFLACLGFGHIEVGTVTAQPQPGNPKPRIVRLPKDRALINRMGFPSIGAEAVAENLRKLSSWHKRRPVLGVNFGRTKLVDTDNAVQDYCATFSRVNDMADYFVVNVSSPNTPELRKLQEKARLTELLKGIEELNVQSKPLLVKLAPDLTRPELDEVLECCLERRVAGIVATNTTFAREGLSAKTEESGGLSGVPLHSKALEMVRHIYSAVNGKLPIVAVGGVFCADDVLAMVKAGGTLVQIYTGFIYEGPALVKRIKREIAQILEKEGIRSISELVGTAKL